MLANLHLLRPLWLIALLPLIFVLWQLTRYQVKHNPWQNLVDAHLLPHLLLGTSTPQSLLPIGLLGVGGLLLVVALAGPVWEQLPQPVYQTQEPLIIALDVSPTMNATDVKPSRLRQAQFKIIDLLARTKEGQTALLVYGAEPFVVSPLTSDTATIKDQVSMLDSSLLPVQGERRPDLLLDEAEMLLQQVGSPSGTILLVTDGLDYVAATQEQAQRLRNQGYLVSVLGVGTEQGAPVSLGDGDFLKDNSGAIVLPKLQREALQTLATVGGGRYITAGSDDGDLDFLFPGEHNKGTKKLAADDFKADQWREEGPWLLLLLLPLAALAFRRGWVAPLLFCLVIGLGKSNPAQAWEWQDLWRNPARQAAEQYKAGNFTAALESLKDLNDGDAAYNRGNTLAKLGRFQDAINAYEQALAANPQDQDAQANRVLMQRILEKQKQQQQQQQSSPTQEKTGSNQGQKSTNKDQKPTDSNQSNTNNGQSEPSSQAQDQSHDEYKNQSNRETPATGTGQYPSQGQPDKKEEGKQGGMSAQPDNNKKAEQSRAPSFSQPDNNTRSAEKDPQDNIATQDGTINAPPTKETPETPTEREARQNLDFMLNKVPDDPTGLLKQRFLLQHMRRAGSQQ